MKKVVSLIMVIAMLFVASGCGDDMMINGRLCETYGLINEEGNKCEDARYRIIVGNFIWGIVLFETFLIAPIYFFGFSLWEPVGPKIEKKAKPECTGNCNE
jgi:hypothetical protein